MTSHNHHRPNMAKHGDPDPIAYEKEIYQKGLSYSRPPFTFNALDWESLASERMSADSRGYCIGSAGTGETGRKNREAFAKWSIQPSRLTGSTSFPDLSVSVLGKKLPFPIAIAPVGVQKIFNPDGELASARAAAKEDVPYIMSTASSASIEEVAEANGDGERWFQLYWPSRENDNITISLLERAKKAGFSALIVTLDTYILGWRPSDMNNGYNPFLRSDQIGVEIGFSDPVFRSKFQSKHNVSLDENLGLAAAEWTRTIFPGTPHSWTDIAFLRAHWSGPIILKGIQTPSDARRAASLDIQGIIVSNHGGRQVDGGVSSLGVLPRIVDAVGDELEVWFDSGIRCGADIVKALALGAKMCLIGRPYVYGLVLGGEDGVAHVLKALLGDTELTMHLAGIKSVRKDDLDRDVLIRESDL